MEVTLLKIIQYLKTLTQGNTTLRNNVLDALIRKELRDKMKERIQDRLLNDIDLLEDVVNMCKNEMPLQNYNEIIAYIQYLRGN